MDYVYICRSGDNEELRYSLRSISKNAPEGRVWLVGGKPDWYSGNFVSVRATSHKYNNARNNLHAIVGSSEISDNFVLMNDDFFVVRKVDEIKTYHGGLLSDKIKRYKSEPGTTVYTGMLTTTYRTLRRRGVDAPLDYELHVPMPMTKEGLFMALQANCLWRSAYGNLANVGGEQTVDVKYYGSASKRTSYPLDGDMPYLSSEDYSFSEMLPMLENIFQNPSEYEAI